MQNSQCIIMKAEKNSTFHNLPQTLHIVEDIQRLSYDLSTPCTIQKTGLPKSPPRLNSIMTPTNYSLCKYYTEGL